MPQENPGGFGGQSPPQGTCVDHGGRPWGGRSNPGPARGVAGAPLAAARCRPAPCRQSSLAHVCRGGAAARCPLATPQGLPA